VDTKTIEQAQTISDGVGNWIHVGKSCSGLAFSYSLLKKYGETIRLFEEARAMTASLSFQLLSVILDFSRQITWPERRSQEFVGARVVSHDSW